MHRRPKTPNSVGDVVVEVGFDGPHEPLVPWHDLGWESAVVAFLDQEEVLGSEGSLGVPDVDVAFALVSRI